MLVPFRISFLATSLAAIVSLVDPRAVHPQRVSLDRVESLIKAGQVDEAKSIFEQWKKSNHSQTNTARPTMLAARLATRAVDAEDAYLAVALTHSTSVYAPEALLRLAQARAAAGDDKQAREYLQRLLSDYPRSEFRAIANEWLTRVAAASATQASAHRRPSANPKRFAVQVAAFREGSNAHAVARQIERAGFTDVRLVTVPDNPLLRVRVGKFETATAANALVKQLKAKGFSAVTVADVAREQPIRN